MNSCWTTLKHSGLHIIWTSFGIVGFILDQISAWRNFETFKNRKDYIKWDYGYYYTLTADRSIDCGKYDNADLIRFVNDIPTFYISIMFYIYFAACCLKIIISTAEDIIKVKKFCQKLKTKDYAEEVSEMLRDGKVSIEDENKEENPAWVYFKKAVNYYSLCLSVTSLYAYKVTYHDCISLTGISSFYVNSGWFWFTVVSFYVVCILPLLIVRTYKKTQRDKCKTIYKQIIPIIIFIFYFLESIIIHYIYLVILQVPWNLYLIVENGKDILLLILFLAKKRDTIS